MTLTQFARQLVTPTVHFRTNESIVGIVHLGKVPVSCEQEAGDCHPLMNFAPSLKDVGVATAPIGCTVMPELQSMAADELRLARNSQTPATCQACCLRQDSCPVHVQSTADLHEGAEVAMRPESFFPQRSVAAAVTVCFSLIIAGCGGGDAPAPSSGTSSSTTPSEHTSAESPNKPSETESVSVTTEAEKNAPAEESGATGTLVGSVVFKGDFKPLPLIHQAGTEGVKDGAICAKHDVPNQSLLVNPEGNGVANAFVYLSKAPKGYTKGEPPTEPLVMDQKGCVFLPRALVVQTGQTMLIKSDDEVPHNVHTFPTFQESFNQICQPKERDGLKLIYQKPERQPVQVKCDIHPWMQAWHLPVDHPFAAVSDSSGRFRIEGLPVGVHKFRVWHEKAGQVEKSLEVTISANTETEVTVTINQEQLAQITKPTRTILLSSLRK